MRWDLAIALIIGLVAGYVLAVALTRPQIVATPMSDAMPDDEAPTAMGAVNAVIARPLATNSTAAPLRGASLHLVDENIDSLATA